MVQKPGHELGVNTSLGLFDALCRNHLLAKSSGLVEACICLVLYYIHIWTI
jgi:hypothetical protein